MQLFELLGQVDGRVSINGVVVAHDWLKLFEVDRTVDVEAFAFGYLFLAQRPADDLPIPDLRTVSDHGAQQASTALRDTIHAAWRRQAWYRGYLIEQAAEPLTFVGSISLNNEPKRAAEMMRERLGLPEVPRTGDGSSNRRDLVNLFLSGADPWLIAKAKVLDATVVTHESLVGPDSKKVKIPNVCRRTRVTSPAHSNPSHHRKPPMPLRVRHPPPAHGDG